MDIQEIDWNQAWKEVRAKRTSPVRDSKFWNKRAPSFAQHAVETGYPEAFLQIMNPEPQWSVLDMACGGGTLALPLAGRVRAITAVDFSDTMLDILRERCRKQGISNVRTINASWEDDWNVRDIGIHDVAIASRSLVVEDLRGAIIKLDNIARQRVYVSTIVGDGPYDRRIFEALGRNLHMGPDYIYNYNMLYQMGIHARVTFIAEKDTKTYKNHEDAFNQLRWMLDRMTPAEEEALQRHLEDHLTHFDGNWKMDYERTIKWAVMWWGTQRN